MHVRTMARIKEAVGNATPQNMVRWARRQDKAPISYPFVAYINYAARMRSKKLCLAEGGGCLYVTDHTSDVSIPLPEWYIDVALQIGTYPQRDRLVAELHYQILLAR